MQTILFSTTALWKQMYIVVQRSRRDIWNLLSIMAFWEKSHGRWYIFLTSRLNFVRKCYPKGRIDLWCILQPIRKLYFFPKHFILSTSQGHKKPDVDFVAMEEHLSLNRSNSFIQIVRWFFWYFISNLKSRNKPIELTLFSLSFIIVNKYSSPTNCWLFQNRPIFLLAQLLVNWRLRGFVTCL